MKVLFAAVGLMLATAAPAESVKEPFMFHAAGEFDVALKPVSAADEAFMRMSDRQAVSWRPRSNQCWPDDGGRQ
jgi:hypothetical protein